MDSYVRIGERGLKNLTYMGVGGIKNCQNLGKPMDKIIIIKPNWLSVDKAIIFFKSNSKFAPNPAINIVKPEINNKKTI